MAVALEDWLPGIDHRRLLQTLVLHDLGQSVRGDVPALERSGDKTADERADSEALLAPLPAATAARLPEAAGVYPAQRVWFRDRRAARVNLALTMNNIYKQPLAKLCAREIL